MLIIQLKQQSLRNLEQRCLLTDLPDEWMRMEEVEEELEQNRRLRLCQKPLMRLTVVEEEGGGGDQWKSVFVVSAVVVAGRLAMANEHWENRV
ncbi:hypothetical protein Tco_0308400 [Tanacetum coccineum]